MNPMITRYQREAIKALGNIGIQLPDLATIRKNFKLSTAPHKSLRDQVFASVAAQGVFKMRRGGSIPGLEHYENIKLQNRINSQIRANLRFAAARPSKYYKPFNISTIRGSDKKSEERAYRRAITIMTGKTTSKFLGRYVGGYRGLITSIANAFGLSNPLIKDIVRILQGQLRALEQQWSSKDPKITTSVKAASSFLQSIEDQLPHGVSVKVMFSSDQVLIKTFIIELTIAVGLNPDDYKAEIAQIMRDTNGANGATM